MRTTEQQLREILSRAESVKARRAQKRRLAIDGAAAALCLVLLLAASASLPRLPDASAQGAAVQYGSLILASGALPLVVIGVLAFALGVCVTLLCVHLRAMRERERERK